MERISTSRAADPAFSQVLVSLVILVVDSFEVGRGSLQARSGVAKVRPQ